MQAISFVSSKGGVGKSTLTANVAVALHQRGYRVLAIDLDPQNSLRLHLGMDAEDQSGIIREGLQRHALFTSPFGVHFAPFGDADDADIKEFGAFLQDNPRWLAGNLAALEPLGFDFVCIDTPPGPTPYLQQALQASDRAIAIVLADAASYATVPQIAELVALHTRGRDDFRGLTLLINQMPLSSRLGHQVRTALGGESDVVMAPVSIHHDPRVGMAMANQEPAVVYAPNAMVSMDIEYLVDWLLDQTTP